MASPRSGKTRLLRDLNLNIILNVITKKGPLSRVDVARLSGLPQATVSRITNEFVASGLILEKSSEKSSGGRPPVLLEVNPTAGYVLGVNLERDKIVVALCDLQATALYTHTLHTLREEKSPEKVIAAIVDAITHCLDSMHVELHAVIGIGLCLRGLVDAERGICHVAADFPWHDIALADMLEARLHVPVRIENSANTLATLELHAGIGNTVTHFLYLIIGHDLGLGVILNGDIYHGRHGYAGAFEHYRVDHSPQAPRCYCGQRGCLAAIIGDEAWLLPDSDQARPENSAKVQELHNRAGLDNISPLHYAGSMLGVAIANLINIFDPERIIITGRLAQNTLMMQAVHTSLREKVFDQDISSTLLTFIANTSEASEQKAHAAASLVLHELLQPPLYEHEQSTISVENILVTLKKPHSIRERS
jgi:predicted NBD/HSP70 family sugar kinase